MSLRDKLQADIKTAMKARESGKLTLKVLRMAMAAIKNKEIDTRENISEADILDILAKEVKLRRESLAEFEKAGRKEQVEELHREIAVLKDYLPEQLTEQAIRQLVQETITETGANSVKDMGKVMGALMPKVKGKADGKLVNEIVRELLDSVGLA